MYKLFKVALELPFKLATLLGNLQHRTKLPRNQLAPSRYFAWERLSRTEGIVGGEETSVGEEGNTC